MGDREAVPVRKLDVEQEHVRLESAGCRNGLASVGSFADHLVASRLEQLPRVGAEDWMVIDDEDGARSGVPAES
jgi:hypothetical protein